jgi:hypothetical protein
LVEGYISFELGFGFILVGVVRVMERVRFRGRFRVRFEFGVRTFFSG